MLTRYLLHHTFRKARSGVSLQPGPHFLIYTCVNVVIVRDDDAATTDRHVMTEHMDHGLYHKRRDDRHGIEIIIWPRPI